VFGSLPGLLRTVKVEQQSLQRSRLMKQTLIAIALLCLGMAANAAAQTPEGIAPVSATTASLPFSATPAPVPLTTGPCTITCPYNPSISCSGSSSCTIHFDGRDAIFIITCDGHNHACI
jgi:hypothetical protein